MKRAWLLAASVALGWHAGANSQEGSPVRLDEFAVPLGETGSSIDQVTTAGTQPLPSSAAKPQPDVAAANLPVPADMPVAQISRPGAGETAPQVSDPAQSREVAARSVSSPGDSRPRGVTRLGGQDRCDPQQPADQLARCEQILERRAAEFQAAEAPRLSPEQALLAAQGERGGPSLAQGPLPRLARSADGSPDAGSQDNQELAAIVLTARESRAEPEAPGPKTEVPSESLAEALGALGITVAPAP